jgi:hypothetical protein
MLLVVGVLPLLQVSPAGKEKKLADARKTNFGLHGAQLYGWSIDERTYSI